MKKSNNPRIVKVQEVLDKWFSETFKTISLQEIGRQSNIPKSSVYRYLLKIIQEGEYKKDKYGRVYKKLCFTLN